MVRDVFNFKDLKMDGVANRQRDIVFDGAPCANAGTANVIPLQMRP